MKSSIEILVHLKKFTNIDLFSQGIYQIRVIVPDAQPYLILKSNKIDPFSTNEVDEKFIFYEENIEDMVFYSQGFLIRYEDEEMPTNIGCVFRLQESQKIEIIMELLFLDKKLLGDMFNDNLQQLVQSLRSQMQVVSKATFTITEPQLFNSAYYPVEFDTAHFCLVETQIHTITTQILYNKLYIEQNITNQKLLDELLNNSILILKENRKKLNEILINIYEEKKFCQFQYEEQIYDINNQNLEKQISKSLHDLHHDMYSLWCEFIAIIKEKHQIIQNQLEQEYLFSMKERWINCVITKKTDIKPLEEIQESGKINHEKAKQIRTQIDFKENKTILYKELLTPLNIHPIIFKHNSLIQDFQQKFINQNIHYIVLVHGYQGTSYDMRYWKSMLTIRFKDKIRLISPTCNDQVSNKLIDEQGQNLANEVRNYLYDEQVQDFRLSFIGHSLGGLIIRSALPHLKEFSQNMYTYASLASPHCGYASSESVLVDTGLQIIQKWNKCRTLEELSQKDHKDIRKTFLYRLSEREGLSWFKNIVVLASFQDFYVPFHSAMIQKIDNSNDQRVIAYNEMVKNILKNCQKIDRFDINFIINKKKLDKFIGRAAHIEFIDNLQLVKMFTYLFDEYFH